MGRSFFRFLLVSGMFGFALIFGARATASSTGVSNGIGINLSGAEYSWMPFAGATQLDYLKSQNMTLIRLPISWERMQPILNGPLDNSYLSGLKNFLSLAAARGMVVIVDVHNYGRYNPRYAQDAAANYGIIAPDSSNSAPIGSPSVPISAFSYFWSLMAAALKGTPGLGYYGLMNEPYNMGSQTVWPAAAQAAVNAIRNVDMNTSILVAGTQWSSAYYWPYDNGNLRINDPADNFYYEAHQYFDGNGSGTYPQTYDQQGAYPTLGVDRIQPFLNWLKQNGARGFLGEFGVPSNDPRWQTVLNNVLIALKANGIMGTNWTFVYPDPSGRNSWWPNSQSVDPLNIRSDTGMIQPQMETLFRQTLPLITTHSLQGPSLTLNGIAGAGNTVSVYNEGVKIGNTTANSTGSWNFTTQFASSGVRGFTAIAMNAAGSISSVSPIFSVTVATSTPQVPVALEAENMTTQTVGAFDGASSWLLWSNGHVATDVQFPSSSVYSFNVRAKADLAAGIGANMEVRLDGVVIGTMAVNSNVLANYAFQGYVSAGTHTLAIAFTNDYYSAPEDRNLYVNKVDITLAQTAPADTIAPSVSITSPTGSSTVRRNDTVTIAASASDNVGVRKVEFYIDGAILCVDSTATYSCTWKVPGAIGKTYAIEARVYDAAGNTDSQKIQVRSSR